MQEAARICSCCHHRAFYLLHRANYQRHSPRAGRIRITVIMQGHIARLFALIGLSIVFLEPLLPASAATYYIAATGNDSNPGTLASPWATVQKAADTMVAGDTAIVEDGTYVTPEVVFRKSGAAGNPITLIAQNKWQAILSSTSGCTPGIVVFASYITIENLRLASDPSNVYCGHYTAQNAILWAGPGTDAHPNSPSTQYSHLTFQGNYADASNVAFHRSI